MKKALVLFCLFALCTAFMCDNEPVDFVSEDTITNSRLLGEWFLLDFDVDIITTTNNTGEPSSTIVEAFSISSDYSLNFTETDFTTTGNYGYISTLETNDEQVNSEFLTAENISRTSSYSSTGSQITTQNSFFEFNFQESNTSTQQTEQTLTFAISNTGETLTFTQNETITFTDPNTSIESTRTKIMTSKWSKNPIIVTCDLQSVTNQAAIAYFLDEDDTQLCIAYRTALENQILQCGDANGSLQVIVNELDDCGLSSSETLRVTVGSFTIYFTQQTVTLDNGIITIEGASSGGHYTVFFQVEENQLGTNIFQNFKIGINDTDHFPLFSGNNEFISLALLNGDNFFNATFHGTVMSADGGELLLSQGVVDVNY